MPKVVDRPYNEFLGRLVAGFSAEYGLSEPAARLALAHYCLGREPVDSRRDHAVADRFTSGESLDSIAADFGVSAEMVRYAVAWAYCDARLAAQQCVVAYEKLEDKVRPYRRLIAEQVRRRREAVKGAKAA